MNTPSSEQIRQIRERLLGWGCQNSREFPWRQTRDPYAILVAEVLLHRTRASQVVPIYQQFMERYPNIATLAGASPAELQQVLWPLGLHWRVPLIREMARQILEQYGGQVPADRNALRQLPGVSDYIADAVLCFAFNQTVPILDTNTVRVLARLFDHRITDRSRRSRRFRELMSALVDPVCPRKFNQALLDLAALICRPRDPDCPHCPLLAQCSYGGARHGIANRAAGCTDRGCAGPTERPARGAGNKPAE